MLKIKDNVDLKELEKFGFKPKYNEDTGKLYKYVYKSSMAVYIENKYMRPFRKANEYGEIDLEYFQANFVENVLYDLIQAGLVEKI